MENNNITKSYFVDLISSVASVSPKTKNGLEGGGHLCISSFQLTRQGAVHKNGMPQGGDHKGRPTTSPL
jgi:hypothetical protein